MQVNVGLGPNALELFEYYSLVLLCPSAPSHKIVSNNTTIGKSLRFENFLMRRRNKTQKYEGVIFEQVDSV